jgi:two-component system, response regulator PdtaR
MLPDQRSARARNPPRVLLVEDEPMVRALLAEELRNHGLSVVEAADADEAWAYIQAGGLVDLVFSDVTMPGMMNGIELVRQVKAQYPQIKTILTSGYAGPVNIAELGIFLPKPYRLEIAAKMALQSLGVEP